VSTIAAASVHHGATASLAATDLTHGFRTAFDILTALALVGVVLTVRFLAPAQRRAAAGSASDTEILDSLEEAA
jgi:hypothetical protein